MHGPAPTVFDNHAPVDAQAGEVAEPRERRRESCPKDGRNRPCPRSGRRCGSTGIVNAGLVGAERRWLGTWWWFGADFGPKRWGQAFRAFS